MGKDGGVGRLVRGGTGDAVSERNGNVWIKESLSVAASAKAPGRAVLPGQGRAAPPGPPEKEVRTWGPRGDGTAHLGQNGSRSFRRFPRRWNPTFLLLMEAYLSGW